MERLTERLNNLKRGVSQMDEEEEIKVNKNFLKYVCEYLEQLKSCKDAEEQGLLLRLPCKIGSTLYQPISNRINKYKVIGLCFDITRNEWMYEVAYQIGLEWHKTTCDFDCINKTVFLTKEEARQALAEMEGE